MLGPYGSGDAGVESVRCCKTVYVPAPYVGLLLSGDLTPVEAWQRLRGAIVDAATEDACFPIGVRSRARQGGAEPVDYGATGVFRCGVDDGPPQALPGLHRGEVPPQP